MQQFNSEYLARKLVIFRNFQQGNRISEDQRAKINENFKIKQISPPKFEVLKFSNVKSSTSPPRFKQYSDFTSRTLAEQSSQSSQSKSSNLLPISKSFLTETSEKKALQKISSSLLKSSLIKSKIEAKLIPRPSFLNLKKTPNPLKQLKKSIPTLPSIKKSLLRKSKRFPKVFKIKAALIHYKYLNLHKYPRSKLYEFFPGVAFGHPGSRDFLKACKEGNSREVVKMLEENPWIAHSFDHSRVSAVHWAVIRGHLNVVELLVRAKVWINVGDFVRLKQAGRTPIFLAVKYSNFDIFQFLINSGANPLLKTRAGTGIGRIIQDEKTRTAFNLYRAKKYYKIWLLNEKT
jgi:ankyrin repeat protein